jgi:anthranilate phosphoribosyltransferase
VHGADGLDELTTTGISHVAVLDGGKVSTFKVTPKNAGLPEAKPEDLTGGDAVENAAHIRAVLGGNQGPFRDIVLLNAAAALLVVGKAKTLREGVALAAESIDSGKAKGVLEALVKLSHGKV